MGIFIINNMGLSNKVTFRRIRNKILSRIAEKWMIPSTMRVKLQKATGVIFKDPSSVFIGDDVYLDTYIPRELLLEAEFD